MERKRALLAGSWYPGSAKDCRNQIQSFLRDSPGPMAGDFVGGIVPHAGWFFSGSIACRVMASLRNPAVDTVIVFGLHMHPGSPACILASGSWETPLGDIDIDTLIAGDLYSQSGCQIRSPKTFPEENTIEVQLPMVRYFFPGASLVAVGVPPVASTAARIGKAVVEAGIRHGKTMRVIGSTDLTHYGDNFQFTPAGTGPGAHEWVVGTNDRHAVQAMLSMDGAAIIDQAATRHNLCCSGAVAAAVAAAGALGATRGTEFDYATSYDKSPGSSFVGYAGILFGKDEPA